MNVHVAGQDRSGDLGADITREAEALAARDDAPEFLKYPHSAVFLNSSRDDAQFIDRLTSLLLAKTGTSARSFWIPRRPGLLGGLMAGLKRALWKVLRYQHERMSFQQNVVNLQISATLEFLREEYLRRIEELEDELRALRQQ